MNADFDALVVGGGPAGATTAALLARGGWRVALVEKKRFPRRKVCGEFISATSWPLLHRLGVGAELLPLAGAEVRRVGVFVAGSEVCAELASTAAGEGGHALARELLDTVLLRQAGESGALVLQPATLAAFEDREDHYQCRITGARGQDGFDCRARILVAAHGSWQHGVLPTQQFRLPPLASDLFGFKARFRGDRLAPDLMPLFAFSGGYGGLVHSDGGRLSLSCCLRRDELERCRAASSQSTAGAAVQAHIERECAGVARALAGARLDGAWLAAGPLRTGIRSFGQERIFAVGNAAAEAHPIIAEGISMAIQSAFLLCERLLGDNAGLGASRAQLELLRRGYEADWRANFATRLHVAAALAHLFMRPKPARAASALLQRAPALLTTGSRWSGKARSMQGLH